MKTVFTALVALLILAAAVALGVYGWMVGGDAQMSGHGWAAMAIGVVLSLVVGAGLMALVFFSSRRGYDEGAHYRDDDGEL